uniref:Uncharacterized protein n=1 Tax=Tetranychus urticae TaxID=32264 RepID=T1L078_TETUR
MIINSLSKEKKERKMMKVSISNQLFKEIEMEMNFGLENEKKIITQRNKRRVKMKVILIISPSTIG